MTYSSLIITTHLVLIDPSRLNLQFPNQRNAGMAQPRHTADWVAVQTNIDRKKYGRRIVPMKVLMLGLGRTGTECEHNLMASDHYPYAYVQPRPMP